MKNLFKGIISATKGITVKIENYNLIVDKVWFLIFEDKENTKTTYILRSKNDELLISINGNINKGKWEYIKTSNCLLLEMDGISKIYQILYIRENYLIFQNDFDPTVVFFINKSYFKNKFAKAGSRLMDSILKDIGYHQFLSELQLYKNSIIKDQTHSIHQDTSKTDKNEAKTTETQTVKSSTVIELQYKKPEPNAIDARINKLDDIIKELQKHAK